jgi:hypothetical protein
MKLLLICDEEELSKRIEKISKDTEENLSKEIEIEHMGSPFEAIKRIKQEKLFFDAIIIKDETKNGKISSNEFYSIYKTFSLPKIKILKLIPVKSNEGETLKQLNFNGVVRYPFNYIELYSSLHFLLNYKKIDIREIESPKKRDEANKKEFFNSKDKFIFMFSIVKLTNKNYPPLSYKEMCAYYEDVPVRKCIISKDIIVLIEEIMKKINFFMELDDFNLVLMYLRNKLQILKFNKNIRKMKELEQRLELFKEDLIKYAENLNDETLKDVHYLTASLAVTSISLSDYIDNNS